MTYNRVISIGREFGSGGKLIGKNLAEKLGFEFYDQELINLAAKEIGFSDMVFKETDEQPIKSRFIYELQNFFGGDNNYLSDDKLFFVQSQAIKKVSQKGNCVIMGRCSDYILRDNEKLFSIFFRNTIENRIKIIKERQPQMTEKEILRMIELNDRRRAEYYNYFTGKVWGDSHSYDMCIDVSKLGIENVVEIVYEIIKLL